MNIDDEILQLAQIMGDTVEYGQAREKQIYSLVTIIDESTCIHDPRYDVNGFSPADEGQYGFSVQAVDALVQINTQLIDAQNKFLDQCVSVRNDSIASVQASLGQTEGDLASHFFADDEDLQKQSLQFGEKIAQYALQEFSSKYEYDPSLKVAEGPSA